MSDIKLTTKDQIHNLIDDNFAYVARCLNLGSGDLYPGQQMELDQAIETIARIRDQWEAQNSDPVTNKNWYPNKQMGCFYKLVDGELWFCPMNEDGTPSEDEAGGVERSLADEPVEAFAVGDTSGKKLWEVWSEVTRDLQHKE